LDPLTAALAFATEALKVVEKLIEGQTPEQKAKLWEMYIADVEAWRKFWGDLGKAVA
jgi:hypothetical protein